MAILADITERKRVEAELAEKLRLQKLLAELSTRFVALPSGNIDAAIEAAQRLVVETLDLDRTTLWQIVEPEPGLILTHSWQRPGCPPLPRHFPAERFLPWMHARIIKGEVVCFTTRDELPPEAAHDFETFRHHPPKSTVAIPLIANGQVFGAVAFATLRHERQWREDEVADLKLVAQIIGHVVVRHRADLREEQLRGELAHAMRIATLGELAAALAHELNQPLAAILSNAQAARRFIADGRIEPDELQAILADIIRDDKRAGSIIHNLRAMVGKRPSARETCCLNELVQEVRELMHAELIVEKIELRPALANVLPRVHGARVELQQVLVNLLVNAVHAMQSTPPELRIIELATDADADEVVVTVRDRGHGIQADRLSSIFDPFHSSRPEGLGMGLSICRRIIENHGGRITASNHPDGGALFRFSLPAMPG